jgi:hypothetical protein
MKLSKPISKLKYFSFFLGTLVFGFAAGFFFGAYPEELAQISGRQSHVLTLIFSSEQYVPQKLLQDFEKSTGISYEVKIINSYFSFQSEAQKADLLFIPFSWFENALPTLIESSSLGKFSHLVSSDFLSMRLSKDLFLPIFWKVEKNELLLWGFANGKKESDTKESVYQLISYLLERPERSRLWTEQADVDSCLKDIRSKHTLRDYPLPQLSIQHQLK